jgi:PEP-CTERM motif-containing protein
MKRLILTVALVLSVAAPALAIPELQLWIEGSTYDTSTQTWVTDDSSFKLWVLGNLNGPTKDGIFDVMLSAAYKTGEAGTITLTPATATSGLLPSPGDTSTPQDPAPLSSGSGTVPLSGDGVTTIPTHGIFGTGTDWVSYSLGDFILKDSPIGDFTTSNAFPSSFPNLGQINVYDVTITGFESGVHFDAFDHYFNGNGAHYIKAPFSHDGESTPVPEPGTFLLVGAGLLGLGLYRRRQSK